MKDLNFSFLALILLLALNSCNQSNKLEDKTGLLNKEQSLNKELTVESLAKDTLNQQQSFMNSDSLEFLKTLNGKYSFKVNLFENKSLSKRLQRLLGDKYTVITEDCIVAMPIEIQNDIFVCEGCQEHNCDGTNFIIIYNFSTNILQVGIKENYVNKGYSEDGESSPRINEWANFDLMKLFNK